MAEHVHCLAQLHPCLTNPTNHPENNNNRHRPSLRYAVSMVKTKKDAGHLPSCAAVQSDGLLDDSSPPTSYCTSQRILPLPTFHKKQAWYGQCFNTETRTGKGTGTGLSVCTALHSFHPCLTNTTNLPEGDKKRHRPILKHALSVVETKKHHDSFLAVQLYKVTVCLTTIHRHLLHSIPQPVLSLLTFHE